MTASLMSHLLHPHPAATKINLKEPLAGAILISPWVKFNTNTDSFKRYEKSDMLAEAAVQRWASQYLGELVLSHLGLFQASHGHLQATRQTITTTRPPKQMQTGGMA